MTKYVDFDRMISELRHEQITFRVFGEDIAVTAEVPAALVLELMKYDADAPIPPALVVHAAMQFFGDERVRRWTKRRDCSLETLAKLVETAITSICGPLDPAPNDASKSTPHSKN